MGGLGWGRYGSADGDRLTSFAASLGYSQQQCWAFERTMSSVPALSPDHEGVSFPIINLFYMRS